MERIAFVIVKWDQVKNIIKHTNTDLRDTSHFSTRTLYLRPRQSVSRGYGRILYGILDIFYIGMYVRVQLSER